MANLIRDQINDEYITRLGAIATASGYRIDVATCELGFRSVDEVTVTDMPAIYLVPTGERYQHVSGETRTVREIDLYCYQQASGRTNLAIGDDSSDMIADVRKALHKSPEGFAIEGVVYARVMRARLYEGIREAVKENKAAVIITTEVLFYDDQST